MKKAAAERAESAICHPPLSSLRLSHLPSTPVIWQRGGLPSACMALVPEMFPLCWVPGLGGGDGPDFTPVNTLPCDVWSGKFGPFEGRVFKSLCSQILLVWLQNFSC